MATPTTLNELFQQAAAQSGNHVALRHKVNKVYQDISYSDLSRQVRAMATGLNALGIAGGDRVAILAENCPEWAITDLAALSLGAVIVPLYPTLPTPQVAFILKNSGAKVLVVSDAKQLKKAQEARPDLPDLQHLILMDNAPEAGDSQTVAGLVAKGESEPLTDAAWEARWKSVGPDDVASLVYTSGTTGDPKGAMLTHRNFVWDVDASLALFAGSGEPVKESDTFFSFLPLSHAYERTTGHYLPLRVGASIGYSEGIRTLGEDIAAVKPTLMVCVPRVYEALQERIQDTAAKEPEQKRKIFAEALETGREYADRKREGKGVGLVLTGKHALFEKMVYAPLRERVFGGRIRFLVSGGAALNPETARFYAAVGIPISEGYGMTESAPVIAANPVHGSKVGTVGTILPGGEAKIADDGEILYRGPNVMKGYWKNEQATGEMIDADGWLHTGDVGVLDEDGFLKITDRKKDILVLANGKNVAPQPIESEIKQSPFVTEVVLIGDKQSIITALVVPNKTKLGEWAKAENLIWDGDDALLALPEVKRKIKQEIDAHSTRLAEFERVKKFTLLNTTFSVDSGELTPTQKVKRKVVLQKYAHQVAEMRGGE